MTKQEWLTQYIDFNFNIGMPISHRDVIDTLYIHMDLGRAVKQRPDLTKKALDKFIANIYTSWFTDRPLRISKRQDHYKTIDRYGRNWNGYRRCMSILDGLISCGYIEVAKGYYNGKWNSAMTKIWATEKLSQLFVGEIKIRFDAGADLVLMRDTNKILVDYDDDDNDNIITMRQKIENYNTMLEDADIMFSASTHNMPDSKTKVLDYCSATNYISSIPLSHTYHNPTIPHLSPTPITTHDTGDMFRMNYKRLFRQFSRGAWDLGGRFYGAVHLILPSECRDTVIIDNEPTVELDYSGLHIRMLYHRLGIPFTGECYVFSKHDKPYKDQRSIIKVMSLIAINAKSKSQAINATRKEIRSENRKGKNLPTDLNLDKIYDEFSDHHTDISKYIGSDVGVKLQYQDSMIMDNILTTLFDSSVVALPVHDSIVVKVKHKDLARRVMIDEYEKVMGFKPIVD